MNLPPENIQKKKERKKKRIFCGGRGEGRWDGGVVVGLFIVANAKLTELQSTTSWSILRRIYIYIYIYIYIDIYIYIYIYIYKIAVA